MKRKEVPIIYGTSFKYYGHAVILKGVNNLAKIIALKMGKNFKDNIATLVSGELSERLTKRFEEKIINKRENRLKYKRKKLTKRENKKMPTFT